MATRKLDQFLQKVDEKVLECTICFKRLQNPKSLNCLHSFCLACLEDWIKTKEKLTCPICSKSYPIPEGGLQKLPPNTFINNLLETIEQFSERDQMKCSVCEKEEQVKYYCQDCRQYLCSICSDQHKKYTLLAYHKLRLMEDVQSMSPSQRFLLHPPLCSHHSKPLEFYCTDCKTPICVNCTIMDHKEWEGKHKPISISDAFQTFKKTSDALIKSSQHSINKLEDSLKVVIQNATKLKQNKDACLREIDNHVEEIFKNVKEKRDKIKNEVETIYKRKKKVNDVQMEELNTTIVDINTKMSFLNQLLKSDIGTAMHQSSERVITSLKDRISELPKTEPDDNGQIYFFANKQQMTSLKQCDIGTVKQFKAADYLTLKAKESVIQGQKIIVKIIKTEEHEIYANQLKATWTHPTRESNICQVQEDENGDYFVTGKCTSPGVCKLDVSADDEPINQSPMIIKVEKEGLVNVIHINTTYFRDVVKCEDDCLLVSCKTNEMLKYKQSGEYIGKVTLPQGVKVWRMYKMKNGDIVFNDSNITFIKICNMNGQVIKKVGEGVLTSSGGIHVDETSNVLYVSGWSSSCVYMFHINNGKTIKTIGSHGTKEGQMSSVIDVTLTNQGNLLVLEFDKSRLQLFDNEGRFIKVLVEAGDENGKVKKPRAVVVDEDDNIIISCQHKLQIFSSEGTFIKRIDKPEDGIKDPMGLSIISYHPRRLAVANKGDKTVKIFNY